MWHRLIRIVMIRRSIAAGAVLAAALLVALAAAAETAPLFANDYYALILDPKTGGLNVISKAGAPAATGASAAMELECAGKTKRRLVAGGGQGSEVALRPVETPLGQGLEIAITDTAGGMRLSRVLTVFPDQRWFTARLEVMPGGKMSRCKVKALEPWVLEGKDSGLELFGGADDVTVLENGANLYFDFMVNMRRLRDRPAFPGRLLSPDSVSNASSILYSASSGRSALAGFITAREGIGLIIAGAPRSGARDAAIGQRAREVLRPPLAIADRTAWVSETVLLDFFAPTPFTALEDYAGTLARQTGASPWSGPVPSGWNSWGEYYTDINEDLVLANLDFAAAHFRDFGMDYFQIDDGYSPYWGDWQADPARFPHGLAWLAERIRAKGMKPGIWIAPFCADVRSETYRQHPDWFLPRTRGLPSLMIGKNIRVLDLANPAARDYLRAVIHTYAHEWGYEWIKTDFTYYFLYYSSAGPGDRTMADLYREGLRIIKDEAGPQTFVLGIGSCSLSYGLVDGMRLSLDNMPAWNDTAKDLLLFKPFAGRVGFVQGLVPTARTTARRYWMNHGLWINHPDLIFFNNDRWPEWGPDPITFEQARSFASMVGLSAGIVKIGDKLVDMTDAEVDVVRRILPVVRPGARPLDLFETNTPELWCAEYRTGFETWDVVGFFNWGRNWRDGRELPAGDRHFTVTPAQLGLDPGREYLAFDFWPERFIGPVPRNGLDLSVGPGGVRIIALRPYAGRPQFLSYNRHLSQGAVEMETIAWDAENHSLTGTMSVVAGFEYHLYFFTPAPYRLVSVEVDHIQARASQDGGVVTLTFTTPETGKHSWKLEYAKP